MLLLFIFLLWSLSLCFINCFRGCVLFSWYLSSQWQWWWLWVKVLWWWWWSLQWWFGKCSSSYLGCHFPKDVVLVHSLTLVIYVIQKTLMGLQVFNIIYFLHGLKKPLVKMFNIIFSLLLCGQKITWEFASVQISLFFSHMWIKKSFASLQKCNIIFFFHLWVEKINYRLASVQYHFFSLPMWIKKTIVGLQVCNIISFLFLHELKKSLASSAIL
jgi:hypothetical protein